MLMNLDRWLQFGSPTCPGTMRAFTLAAECGDFIPPLN